MKNTLKYVALLCLAPCASALESYLQNAPVLDWHTLEHGLVAALIVGLGILAKSPLAPQPPPPPVSK